MQRDSFKAFVGFMCGSRCAILKRSWETLGGQSHLVDDLCCTCRDLRLLVYTVDQVVPVLETIDFIGNIYTFHFHGRFLGYLCRHPSYMGNGWKWFVCPLYPHLFSNLQIKLFFVMAVDTPLGIGFPRYSHMHTSSARDNPFAGTDQRRDANTL